MRKIGQQAAQAFLNAEKFRNGNTIVEVLPNVTILKLHDNPIAYKYNDTENTLSVTTAGWNTNTTKARLNAIPNVHIQTKKGQMYLNGEEWDGELKNVN